MNLNPLRNTIRGQSEVNATIAGRLVASAGTHGGKLRSTSRRDLYVSTDCIVVALHSLQIERNPMIGSWCFVQENPCGTVIRRYNHVNLSVVIQIARGEAPTNPPFLKYLP